MEDFGLIPEKPETTIKTNFDRSTASKLYDALRSANLIPRGTSRNITKWANELRILRKHVSEEEILKVLEWFIIHVMDEYVPKAMNAKKFRLEFDRIVQAMERQGVSSKSVQVTAEAKTILADLDLSWTNIPVSIQLQFIQQNLNFIREYISQLRQLLTRLEKKAAEAKKQSGLDKSVDSRDVRLIRHLYENFSSPRDYTIWWTGQVHNISTSWDGWQGNLLSWVVKRDNKKFEMMMARIIGDYTSDPAKWPRVLELLKEIKDD